MGGLKGIMMDRKVQTLKLKENIEFQLTFFDEDSHALTMVYTSETNPNLKEYIGLGVFSPKECYEIATFLECAEYTCDNEPIHDPETGKSKMFKYEDGKMV